MDAACPVCGQPRSYDKYHHLRKTCGDEKCVRSLLATASSQSNHDRASDYCPQGHFYDEANTDERPRGRRCRECHRTRWRPERKTPQARRQRTQERAKAKVAKQVERGVSRANEPPLHGLPWSDKDLLILRKLVERGMHRQEIADQLGRSVLAVRQRIVLKDMAHRPTTCAHCRAPMKQINRGRPRKWCSLECLQAAARVQSTYEVRLCQVCKAPMPVATTSLKIYCSRVCRHRAWYLRKLAGKAADSSLPVDLPDA